MVDNLADYTLDMELGRVFIFPFEYGPNMIAIRTHFPKIAPEKIGATGLDYNGRKYEVVLQVYVDDEKCEACIARIFDMNADKVSDSEFTKTVIMAEMSAREYFCEYFVEVIKKWVKDHPSLMLKAQKSQDATAKTNRQWLIEKLQWQIKDIKDEIARIDAGEHLPNFSTIGREDEDA
jgi:hypothetical protein